jgi:NAD(P)-dependent dehydrogenase (short-subunit alcohol dehydrogenase family)
MGTLRGLVNCAGVAPAVKTVGKDGPHPLDVFQRAVNINLVGTFNMARLAAEAMGKTEAPNTASAASSSTPPRSRPSTARSGQAAYGSSKAAWPA